MAEARSGQYISIFIPEELLKQIESYRYAQEIPKRVQAIRELIQRGLPHRRGVKASES